MIANYKFCCLISVTRLTTLCAGLIRWASKLLIVIEKTSKQLSKIRYQPRILLGFLNEETQAMSEIFSQLNKEKFFR